MLRLNRSTQIVIGHEQNHQDQFISLSPSGLSTLLLELGTCQFVMLEKKGEGRRVL